MAFGFPAYHELVITNIPAGTDVMRSVGSALSRMGWNPKVEGNTFVATTTFSMASWGEKVTVQVLPNSIKVRSQCSLFTQCIDMGKNKKNVVKFAEELPRHYVATAAAGNKF